MLTNKSKAFSKGVSVYKLHVVFVELKKILFFETESQQKQHEVHNLRHL